MAVPARPRCGPATRGWFACACAVAAMQVLTGCSTPRDPNAPLTADEGAELLREIRDNPVKRKQNLTPAERAYLVKTLKK